MAEDKEIEKLEVIKTNDDHKKSLTSLLTDIEIARQRLIDYQTGIVDSLGKKGIVYRLTQELNLEEVKPEKLN